MPILTMFLKVSWTLQIFIKQVEFLLFTYLKGRKRHVQRDREGERDRQTDTQTYLPSPWFTPQMHTILGLVRLQPGAGLSRAWQELNNLREHYSLPEYTLVRSWDQKMVWNMSILYTVSKASCQIL